MISKYILHSIPNNSNKNPRKSNEYPIIPHIANQLATILFLYRTKHIGMLPIPKESIAIWYPKSYDIFVFSIKFNNILDNAIASITLVKRYVLATSEWNGFIVLLKNIPI